MFILLYIILQDVHSAALHYTGCSLCFCALYRMFIVLYFIIYDVSVHFCFVLLQSYIRLKIKVILDMTLCRCVRKPPLPHGYGPYRESDSSSGTRPKGCVCSINAMRTLNVAYMGLSGERTDVTVAADWASASCTFCIVQACKCRRKLTVPYDFQCACSG
jgi:hypothetical protein